MLIVIVVKSVNKLRESKKPDEEVRKKNIGTITSSPIGEDVLVYHILARLPVKSLMRFKCVCKRLKSVIEEDAKFIDINLRHLRKHPLLCMVLMEELLPVIYEDEVDYGDWTPFYCRQMCLLTANLYDDQGGGRLLETATVDTIDKLRSSSVHKRTLKPINGLICFFNTHSVTREEDIDFSFYIYNIATRKATPWIKSSAAGGKFDTNSAFYWQNPITYTFQFSVNPTTKECKVICVWVIPREKYRKKANHVRVTPREKARKKTRYAGVQPREITHSAEVVCEILTVGEGTWRRIAEVPVYVTGGDSVCVNGYIYWGDWWFKKRGMCSDEPEAILVEFDVENEKFGTIPIPSFIVDQIHWYNRCHGHNYIYYYYKYLNIVELLEVKGRLALLSRIEKHTVKLWMLEDNKKRTTNSNGNWTEVIITLPSDWSENYDVNFHTVAGTTDGIILQVKLRNEMFFYLYSLEKKTLVEFQISGITSLFSGLHGYSLFTTHTESLLPVTEEAPAHQCRDNQISK